MSMKIPFRLQNFNKVSFHCKTTKGWLEAGHISSCNLSCDWSNPTETILQWEKLFKVYWLKLYIPAFSRDNKSGNTLFKGLQIRRKVSAQPNRTQRAYCCTIWWPFNRNWNNSLTYHILTGTQTSLNTYFLLIFFDWHDKIGYYFGRSGHWSYQWKPSLRRIGHQV